MFFKDFSENDAVCVGVTVNTQFLPQTIGRSRCVQRSRRFLIKKKSVKASINNETKTNHEKLCSSIEIKFLMKI